VWAHPVCWFDQAQGTATDALPSSWHRMLSTWVAMAGKRVSYCTRVRRVTGAATIQSDFDPLN